MLFHFKALSFGGGSGGYSLHTAFIEFQIHKVVTLTNSQCDYTKQMPRLVNKPLRGAEMAEQTPRLVNKASRGSWDGWALAGLGLSFVTWLWLMPETHMVEVFWPSHWEVVCIPLPTNTHTHLKRFYLLCPKVLSYVHIIYVLEIIYVFKED